MPEGATTAPKIVPGQNNRPMVGGFAAAAYEAARADHLARKARLAKQKQQQEAAAARGESK